MEKIYGYKEKDVIGLAEFLMNKGNSSLSSVFEKYGVKYGKAKGTVRNLYYALAKRSNIDQEFCAKYLGGKPLSVNKIVEFGVAEERDLIKKVLMSKSQGKSCRSVIMELAKGDGKIALRLQNKYRNAVKNKPELIKSVLKELNSEGISFSQTQKTAKDYVTEAQFEKVKSEINNLVDKISSKTKKENEYLKERIQYLERENLKLYNLLYANNGQNHAVKFFRSGGGENALN
ncbi:MAG: hypothetical protein IKB67_06580 [Clostridia bacterium]|nr:hypothetical protein [Clostridia bacterium]